MADILSENEVAELMVENENIDAELLHDFMETVLEAEIRHNALLDIAEELGCDPAEVMQAVNELPLV